MAPDTPTFLIAHQELSVRETLRELLSGMGFENVRQVQTGTQAWSSLKRAAADFLIAGWKMHEMNGLVLLKVVRSDMVFCDTPFIMVVKQITKHQVIEAGLAGVSDIIVRPFTFETLHERIQALLKLKDDPQYKEAEATYERGVELMQQGLMDEALSYFKRILDIYEDAEIYYNMGFIHTVQGNYGEAIDCFRKATQINNAFARAYQKMGEVYKVLGDVDQAELCFKMAADIYMSKQMDESAELMLQEILTINPNTINIYNSLGIIYRRRKEYDRAADQYLRALKVNPTDENIYYNLARVYVEMKDLRAAKKVVEKSIALNPAFAEAENMLKVICRAIDRDEKDVVIKNDEID